MADIRIREARPGDSDALTAILGAAFPGPDEARLVAALAADGDISLSLLAFEGDDAVGCIVFSPLATPDAPDARLHALAPLAVTPGRQRRGIGARLVRDGLAALKAAGATGAVVLGDPAHYGRFGFAAETAGALECPWSGSYLQALTFSGGRPSGALRYARAFEGL